MWNQIIIYISTMLKLAPFSTVPRTLGLRDIRAVIESGSVQFIAEVKKLAEEERVQVKIRLEYGDIVAMIVQVAMEERSDLIVVGNRPAGLLRQIMGGDIVQQVRSRAPCPVLMMQG